MMPYIYLEKGGIYKSKFENSIFLKIIEGYLGYREEACKLILRNKNLTQTFKIML